MTMKQLPEGWQMVKFGDIAKHISKRVEPSETELEVYVGLEHLDPDSLKIKRHGVPSDVAGQKLLVKKGQIIFGKRRAYQRKVAVADWDCICSAHAMVLEANPKTVLPEFLPVFMQSGYFMERAIAISEGSLSPTIKWKVLEQQKFSLPPLELQSKLIARLSKIENTYDLSCQVENAARSLYKALLFATFEKSSETKKLKSYIRNISSGKSISAASIPADVNEFGVLKVSAVNNGSFNPGENKLVKGDKISLLKNHVMANDLLMSRANTAELVGDVCIVDKTSTKLFLPDKLWKIEPINEHYKLWLFHLLRFLKLNGTLASLSSGTSGSMKNISQKKLLEIDVGDSEKAQEIGEVLQSAFLCVESSSMRVKAILELYKEVLQKSFANVGE
ncbi:type I restriction-modification system, endonuclease S subunit [Vibrio vulnificus YJ016]|uniref:Type I restriction-modification system, endonuclease S subunit n=1 Tax=Vibrio vulnificus (strain YJ016) TaxID=196600 RepID=Q7MJF7_VIBVY|nr:restriction endonuclease subunit S [Vibrio vulnificus]MCU8447858.1 restriction endonuclease subunit S [Vibrio vulnificus]MCU8469814.1 restriction endonuclease subunit S [Vibrio vulnificus]BAC94969.1 type I restriction-modification system, endonuclease S subunit [Vibrio vulnificus YJ016]